MVIQLTTIGTLNHWYYRKNVVSLNTLLMVCNIDLKITDNGFWKDIFLSGYIIAFL